MITPYEVVNTTSKIDEKARKKNLEKRKHLRNERNKATRHDCNIPS